MGLDAGLVERSSPSADGHVRVLSEEEIHLFECSSIGLDPVEASHINDGRSHFFKLVNPRDIFSRRLPHIPVNQRKFDFFCHTVVLCCKFCIQSIVPGSRCPRNGHFAAKCPRKYNDS